MRANLFGLVLLALLAGRTAVGEELPEGVVAQLGSSRFRAGGQLDSIQLSADGKQLATRNVSHLVFRWDVDSGKLLEATQLKKPDAYEALPFVKPGETRRGSKASVSGGLVTIHLADSKELVQFQTDRKVRFEGVALSDDEKIAAAADSQGTIELWDVAKKTPIASWAIPERMNFLSLSSDGSRLAAGSLYQGNRVRLWKIESREGKSPEVTEILPDDGHTAGIQRLAFSGDGSRLVSAGIDNVARVWDVETQKLITRLDSGYQLSLSQRGNILGVHGVNDSTGVGIYDLSDPLAMPMIAAFPEASHHAVSPDGKLVAVLDRMSKTLQVIDLDTGKIRHALEANANSAYSMAWSANSKRLACGTTGAAVQVWDVPSGKLVLEPVEASPHWLALTASGKHMVSARRNQSQGLELWDLETGKLVRSFGEEAKVLGIALLKDERRALCTCFDGKVRVYDVTAGKLLKTLAGHKTWSYAPAISSDERYFATGGIDSTIYLWDAKVLPKAE